MSYINKELLLADIMDQRLLNHTNVAHKALDIFERMVRKQPAADVVEVRHGRWEVCGTFDDFLECSVCRSETYPMSQVINHKYCHHCGAKMDGERTEE